MSGHPLHLLAQTGLPCTLPAMTVDGNRVSRSLPETPTQVSGPADCRMLPGLGPWLECVALLSTWCDPSQDSEDPKVPRRLE